MPLRFRRLDFRVLVCAAAVSGLVFGLGAWWLPASGGAGNVERATLTLVLVVLNLFPVVIEIVLKKFDLFDAKNLILAYYFIIFSLPATLELAAIDYTAGAADLTGASPASEGQALAAIVVGISGLLVGLYSPMGSAIGRAVPPVNGYTARWRIYLLIGVCLTAGLAAFIVLMHSSGGILRFLSNLASWRTLGVAEGVGHLTFPIAVVFPAGAMLAFSYALRGPVYRIGYRCWASFLLCGLAVGLVMLLGFRISVVPILLQMLTVWHYRRRAFSAAQGVALLILLTAAMSFVGVWRDRAAGSEIPGLWLRSVLFRVPGIHVVERVVWRRELGEPARGATQPLVEAATILVPRRVWPAKPVPGTFEFADTFFYDYFLDRGDHLFAPRSGISPTLVGELLWIGGIAAVVAGAVILGTLARALYVWYRRNRGPVQTVLYATAMSWMPLFVEAPQNTLNGFAILLTFGMTTWIILTFRGSARRQTA